MVIIVNLKNIIKIKFSKTKSAIKFGKAVNGHLYVE